MLVAEPVRVFRRAENNTLRIAAIVVGALAALGVLGYGVGRLVFPSVLLPHSVALFRLRTASGAELEEALAMSVAEDLKDALTISGKTDVVDARSAAVADPLTQGFRISAESILTGTVMIAETIVKTQLALTRVNDGKVIWTGNFDGPASSWFVIGDKAASSLITALLHEVPVVQHHTADPAADQLYWRGMLAMRHGTQEGLKAAITHFQASALKDPAHALAWAGLADASILLAAFDVPFRNQLIPRAKAAARRAIELDPTIAEPHATLAMIAAKSDWDWDESERELKRALDLNPHYAPAYHAYGKLLVLTGKTDAGLAALRQAAHLDPLSPQIAADQVKYLYLSQRYDDAISSGRELPEVTASVHRWLAAAYLAKGMTEQQKAELNLAEAGQPAAIPDSFDLAVTEAQAGNKDKAFPLLEDAFSKHLEGMTGLKVDPRLENLRTDARFGVLLRKMRLA